MRIVIVEDEAPIRNGMGNVLQKLDDSYELVGMGANGIEGLEVIEESKPDLVIMDIRMPDMDGLTMLRKLREAGNNCHAIVLSAYSEFSYAKEAIELGIDSYLLKPIKLAELSDALKMVEKHLGREKKESEAYALDKVLLAAFAGQPDKELHTAEILLEEFGFDANGELGIFLVWLDGYYKTYADEVVASLEKIGESSGHFQICVLRTGERDLISAILYNMDSKKETVKYLRRTIAPMILSQTAKHAVMGLHYCRGIESVKQSAFDLYNALDYHLILGEDELVYYEEVQKISTEPFKYPIDIENRMKQSVLSKDETDFMGCLKEFFRICESGVYSPKDVKEAYIRYSYSMFYTAKECGSLKEEEFIAQKMLHRITDAITGEEIEAIFQDFLHQIETENVENVDDSLLIRRARNLMKEYFNQGITLEETARKLGVSDEHLSARFRKETGATFSETIRQYRVEKIKELLITSNLKLTQIASQTGYADSKYMSKVFKEETGMLPLEYRKLNT